MTTIMFLLAATLLVVCLLLFGALLGARSMLETANNEIETLGRFADRCERRIAELDQLASQVNETIETLTKQRDDAIEEVTRISCELAVCKLSLKNAQNQFEEQSQITLQVENERDDYKDMLRSIAHIFAYERDLIGEAIKEQQDFEAQGG